MSLYGMIHKYKRYTLKEICDTSSGVGPISHGDSTDNSRWQL